MDPFRKCFSHLHRQAVEIEIVAVLIGREQALGEGCRPLSHGHGLHGQHIRRGQDASLAGGEIAVEIGDAITITPPLARQQEAAQLGTRISGQGSRGHGTGVVHNHPIALATAGEIAVHQSGSEQGLLLNALDPVAEHRFGLLSQHRFIVLAALVLGLAQLPLASEESTAIEVSKNLSQGNGVFLQHLGAPEGGSKGWFLGHHFRAPIACISHARFGCHGRG